MITNIKDPTIYEVELKGLSTDTKPVDVGINSSFYELDTGETYQFSGETWAKIPSASGSSSGDGSSSGLPPVTEDDNGKMLKVVNGEWELSRESGGLVEITYSELKTLRDGGNLVAGMQYRITDYICTVANDENAMVESHPYDIIVIADSESVLNENARAMLKDNDNYYHVAGWTDAVLGNWKLKYCLDNDTNRFQWADTVNGKGVVYYLKDDKNNECWYDFKQIKFKRYQITSFSAASSLEGFYIAPDAVPESGMTVDNENPYWFFTFSGFNPENENAIIDTSINANTLVQDNTIKDYRYYPLEDEEVFYPMSYLSRNVFIGYECYSNTIGEMCYSNTFGDSCYLNSLEINCYSNTFGNQCQSNALGSWCSNNIFGNSFTNNTLIASCSKNTADDGCYNNTFGMAFNFNKLGGSCRSNTFGSDCSYNNFGNECYYIKLGKHCTSNTLGNNCQSITLGNWCNSNTFGDWCQSITLEDSCNYNIISKSGTSMANRIRYYKLLSATSGTAQSPLDHISHITFSNQFTTYIGYNSSGTLQYYDPMDSATLTTK